MAALTRWALGYQPPPHKRTRLIKADSIPLRAIDWVIPDCLARRKCFALVGAPAHGKSTLACAITARVTQGGNHPSWPDPRPTLPGNVAFRCSEEDFSDTVLPRLEGAGADISRVYHLDGTMEQGEFRAFRFSDSDIDSLIWGVNRIGGVDLIIIDPIGQAISGDAAKNWRTQDAWVRLTRLAEALNCAILGIAHVMKFAKGRDVLARVAGPIAMAGAPRGMMLTAKVEAEASEGQERYVLVRTKSSHAAPGGGYLYCIVPTIVQGKIETNRIEWIKTLEGSAQDILAWAEKHHPPDGQRALDRAIVFLKLCLQYGPKPYPEVCQLGGNLGFSIATLKRAGASLQVVSYKQRGAGQFSPFMWGLPSEKKDSG